MRKFDNLLWAPVLLLRPLPSRSPLLYLRFSLPYCNLSPFPLWVPVNAGLSLYTSLWVVRCYELSPFMQMWPLLSGPEVTLSHWQPCLPTLQVICWVCQALQNHVNAIIVFVIIIISGSISCFPSFTYCLEQVGSCWRSEQKLYLWNIQSHKPL